MLLALRRETFLLSGLSLNFGKIQTQAFPLEKKNEAGFRCLGGQGFRDEPDSQVQGPRGS